MHVSQLGSRIVTKGIEKSSKWSKYSFLVGIGILAVAIAALVIAILS